MHNLLIIAAGNGKRMGNTLRPKALFPINGKPNIEWLLESARGKFDTIYIVCKHTTASAFKYLESDKVVVLPINSGLGDGHAVLNAMAEIDQDESLSTIAWGDLHCPSPDIFDELSIYVDDICKGKKEIVVPLAIENDPYVHFTIDNESNIVAANFSKYGETTPRGLHDQSIFMGANTSFSHYLNILHTALWKNGEYVSKTGELNLLYVFHLMHNMGIPAYAHITEIIMNSYNTVNEAEKI